MRFDDLVLDVMLIPLRRLSDRLTRLNVDNLRYRPDQLIGVLENIKSNESLRPYYAAMYNQCLVLLVSYFAAAVRELYVDALAAAFDQGTVSALLETEVRITARELRESPAASSYLVAQSFADSKDVSFQDMQSIDRAFRRFFPGVPERGQMVNDIVAGQALRHAIVHSGGVVDRKVVQQLRGAVPRTIRPVVVEGESVSFQRAEVRAVAKKMLKYIRDVAEVVERTGTRLPRGGAGKHDARVDRGETSRSND